jgi:hypothetical protein
VRSCVSTLRKAGRDRAPEVPCRCFVHFAGIQVTGYRELQAGQRAQFTFGRPGAPAPCRMAVRIAHCGLARRLTGDAQAPIAADDDVTPRGLAS